ncbi:MAG: tetratricopeptide repeat protein, partial [Lachnospiraceae bacterium]|nr:tetratricopeptide repeat protein [Lachnospiraceae bacterium]
MFCIHCGKEILNGTTFCAFCGKPQQSTPNPQINPVSQAQPVPQAAQANPVPPAPQINPMPAPSPAPQKKKSRRGFVIGLVAAIVAVIAIAVGVGVIVYSNSPARRLQQQLDLGARYLSELDYEQAIAAYEAALEIDPKSAEAYGGLIDAYSGMGDADGLLRVYAAAKEQLTEE